MKRLLSLLLILVFLSTDLLGPYQAYAQQRLPAPILSVPAALSPAINPPLLKGIKVHRDDPFRFDFILDKGDGDLSAAEIETESSRLIKYFLASITVPEKDLWVNLSPYEKDRIVPESFGQTEMGRDLLAQDYLLKQITASLMFPDNETGKKFWEKIRAEAMAKFGTSDIPVDTFNKVWIIPEKAVVYENAEAGTAYVVESKLKVMLEEDYVAMSKNVGAGAPAGPGRAQGSARTVNELGSQIIRDIVIPELTKEVNEGQNFIKLRQVYNSLILANWYKKKIKDSILSEVYADQNKIAGVNIEDPNEKQTIYEQYLEAFKKGAYDYIKEEYDPATQSVIPRKYFSGGVTLNAEVQTIDDFAMLNTDHAMVIQVNMQPADRAQPSAEHSTSLPSRDEAMAASRSTEVFNLAAGYAFLLENWTLLLQAVKVGITRNKYDYIQFEKAMKSLHLEYEEHEELLLKAIEFKVIRNYRQLQDQLNRMWDGSHGNKHGYIRLMLKAMESKLISTYEQFIESCKKTDMKMDWKEYVQLMSKAVEFNLIADSTIDSMKPRLNDAITEQMGRAEMKDLLFPAMEIKMITEEEQLKKALQGLKKNAEQFGWWNEYLDVILKAVELGVIKNYGYEEFKTTLEPMIRYYWTAHGISDHDAEIFYTGAVLKALDLNIIENNVQLTELLKVMNNREGRAQILVKAIELRLVENNRQLQNHVLPLDGWFSYMVIVKAIESKIISNEDELKVYLGGLKLNTYAYLKVAVTAVKFNLIEYNYAQFKEGVEVVANKDFSHPLRGKELTDILLSALEAKLIKNEKELNEQLAPLLEHNEMDKYIEVISKAMEVKLIHSADQVKEYLIKVFKRFMPEYRLQHILAITIEAIRQGVIKENDIGFYEYIRELLFTDLMSHIGIGAHESNLFMGSINYLGDYLAAHEEGLGEELNKQLADDLTLIGVSSGSYLHSLISLCLQKGIITNQMRNSISGAETRWTLNPNVSLPAGAKGQVQYRVLGFTGQGAYLGKDQLAPNPKVVIKWEDVDQKDVYVAKAPRGVKYWPAQMKDKKGSIFNFISYLGESAENLGSEFEESIVGNGKGLSPNATAEAAKRAEAWQYFRFDPNDIARKRPTRTIWHKGSAYHVAFLGFKADMSYAIYQVLESGAVFFACINNHDLKNRVRVVKSMYPQFELKDLAKAEAEAIDLLKEIKTRLSSVASIEETSGAITFTILDETFTLQRPAAVAVVNDIINFMNQRMGTGYGTLGLGSSPEEVSAKYQNILKEINKVLFSAQVLKSMAPYFSFNEFEWLKSAGESLTIGQGQDLHDVSHYPVFEEMHKVSQPVEIVDRNLAPYAYVRLDTELSKVLKDPMIKGRQILLGQGKTVKELLADVGITQTENISVVNATLESIVLERQEINLILADKAMNDAAMKVGHEDRAQPAGDRAMTTPNSEESKRWIKMFEGTLIQNPDDIAKYAKDIEWIVSTVKAEAKVTDADYLALLYDEDGALFEDENALQKKNEAEYDSLIYDKSFPKIISAFGKRLPEFWPALMALARTSTGSTVVFILRELNTLKDTLGEKLFFQHVSQFINIGVKQNQLPLNKGANEAANFFSELIRLLEIMREREINVNFPELLQAVDTEKQNATVSLKNYLFHQQEVLRQPQSKDDLFDIYDRYSHLSPQELWQKMEGYLLKRINSGHPMTFKYLTDDVYSEFAIRNVPEYLYINVTNFAAALFYLSADREDQLKSRNFKKEDFWNTWYEQHWMRSVVYSLVGGEPGVEALRNGRKHTNYWKMYWSVGLDQIFSESLANAEPQKDLMAKTAADYPVYVQYYRSRAFNHKWPFFSEQPYDLADVKSIKPVDEDVRKLTHPVGYFVDLIQKAKAQNRNKPDGVDGAMTGEQPTGRTRLSGGDGAMTVLTDAQMKSVISSYFRDYKGAIPDFTGQSPEWLGNGEENWVIGFGNSAYRILYRWGEAGPEEENFRVLGSHHLSPRLLSRGEASLFEGNNPYNVLEVERIFGYSLDSKKGSLSDEDLGFLIGLFDKLIELKIVLDEVKPANFMIGNIHREGEVLPKSAYVSDVGRRERNDFSYSPKKIIALYIENIRAYLSLSILDPEEKILRHLEERLAKAIQEEQSVGDGAMNATDLTFVASVGAAALVSFYGTRYIWNAYLTRKRLQNKAILKADFSKGIAGNQEQVAEMRQDLIHYGVKSRFFTHVDVIVSSGFPPLGRKGPYKIPDEYRMDVYEHRNGLKIIRKRIEKGSYLRGDGDWEAIAKLARAQRGSIVPLFTPQNKQGIYFELDLRPFGYQTLFYFGVDWLTDQRRRRIISAVNDGLRYDRNTWFEHGHPHGGNILIKTDEQQNIIDVRLIDFNFLHELQVDDNPVLKAIRDGNKKPVKEFKDGWHVKIPNIHLDWMDLTGFDFENMIYTIRSCVGSILNGTNLSGAQTDEGSNAFYHSDMRGLILRNGSIYALRFYPGTDWTGIDLHGTQTGGVEFELTVSNIENLEKAADLRGPQDGHEVTNIDVIQRWRAAAERVRKAFGQTSNVNKDAVAAEGEKPANKPPASSGLDNAQLSEVGGIDFTADKASLEIQNAGESIKFNIDHALLEEYRNAPGFVPVIINVQPLMSLPLWLGVSAAQPSYKEDFIGFLGLKEENKPESASTAML